MYALMRILDRACQKIGELAEEERKRALLKPSAMTTAEPHSGVEVEVVVCKPSPPQKGGTEWDPYRRRSSLLVMGDPYILYQRRRGAWDAFETNYSTPIGFTRLAGEVFGGKLASLVTRMGRLVGIDKLGDLVILGQSPWWLSVQERLHEEYLEAEMREMR